MGALKSSKNHTLLYWETKNAQAKGKHKGKERKNIKFNTKDKHNPLEGSSGSKKDKHNKFDKDKCSYCKRGNHIDNMCMKKTIDQMYKLLE